MTTTTARMTVRKGNLADMPKLLPGEFGLATDIQRLFIGQATVNGTCQVSNSDATTAKVEFTSANGDPIDLDLIDNLDDYTYGITVNPASDNISITGNNIISRCSFTASMDYQILQVVQYLNFTITKKLDFMQKHSQIRYSLKV